MPRYINADKIVFWVRHVSSNGKLSDTDVRKVAFSDEIARIPTADVVPRSEVENIISDQRQRLNEYKKQIVTLQEKLEQAKAEVVREIFEEIEEIFRQHTEGGYYLNGAWFPERFDLYTGDAIAELKKKYTEGEQDVQT